MSGFGTDRPLDLAARRRMMEKMVAAMKVLLFLHIASDCPLAGKE